MAAPEGAPARGEKLAFLVCGALGREVAHLVRQRDWPVDLYAVPALLHFHPKKIVAAVRQRLQELGPRYRRVVVVYGDCGTAGALDRVLEELGAERVAGPHCYEMFAGPDFPALMEERPGTFFLTDWLVRAFDRAVVRGLGLDRYPELKEVYFGHYTDVLYLQQFPQPELEARAGQIAAYLDLPLEVRRVGLGDLEHRLVALVEGPGG